jgi:hypothetical protein
MNTTEDLDPATEDANDPANAAAAELEGAVREFLRRDISTRQRTRTPTTGDTAAEHVNSLLQRVSVSSTEEVERVISELQAMRDALCTESDRVQRAAAHHTGTSQAATESMRIVADGLRQLKTLTPPLMPDNWAAWIKR